MGVGNARIALGRHGEDLAAELLQASGFVVLERNWRCVAGEVDIIARDVAADAVVFCEVKARRGLGFGDPLESITADKLRRLRRLAGHWLAAHDAGPTRIRLDAIGVLLGGPRPRLRHVRGIG
ncbi:YraN family protein [Naumannella huperziae]